MTGVGRKPSGKDGGGITGADWMLTLADLLALLLTFLVMIYSMRTLEADKWRDVLASLTGSFASPGAVELYTPGKDSPRSMRALVNLDYVATLLEDRFQADPALSVITITRRDKRLILTLPAETLLLSGRFRLSPVARAQVAAIAGQLSGSINSIRVVGHAHGVAPDTAVVENQWELSLWKALTVKDGLESAGFSGLLLAAGAEGPAADGTARGVDIEIWNERWVDER